MIKRNSIPEFGRALVGDGEEEMCKAWAHVAGGVGGVAGWASHTHDARNHHPADEERLAESLPDGLPLLGQKERPLLNHQRAVN